MVTKKSVRFKGKVGIIQMTLGLILLIGSVIALLVSSSYFEEARSDLIELQDFESLDFFKNSSFELFSTTLQVNNLFHTQMNYLETKKTVVYCTEIILLVLAIMLVLNGLANIKE